MITNSEGTFTTKLSRTIVSFVIASALIFSGLSASFHIGIPNAHAEKDGKGRSAGHDNNGNDHGDKGKSSKDQTDSGEGNSTSSVKGESGAEHGSNDNGDNGKSVNSDNNSSSGSTHDTVKQKKHDIAGLKSSQQQYVNQTAEDLHKKHLKMNATKLSSYTSNMTYSLRANGTADAIGENQNGTADSSLSLDMSVWKSTPGMVSMDVMNGSLTVGEKTLEIESGQAHYLMHAKKILLIGYIIENEYDNNDNSTNTVENQTSSYITNSTVNDSPTNQTGTSAGSNQTLSGVTIPDTDDTVEDNKESEQEPHVKLLKLWIKTSEGESTRTSLPLSESPSAMDIEIMSPQSKLASEWFLDMDGEISLHS